MKCRVRNWRNHKCTMGRVFYVVNQDEWRKLSITKPILFNTEMVRAILDGRKTTMRQVIKPQPDGIYTVLYYDYDENYCSVMCGGANIINGVRVLHDREERIEMPYAIGDVLYVRETWTTWNGHYEYKADVEDGYGPFCAGCIVDICLGECNSILEWHPPVHMPKEAARIFLQVTNVRAERLQDMTMVDMQAEGVVPDNVTGGQWQQWQRDYMKPVWDSTIKAAEYEAYRWEANPWVWVIEFEQISKEDMENETNR